MGSRFVPIALAFALVATAGFAAGGSEDDAAATATADGGPQYGGTLTWLTIRAGDEPKSWDTVHMTNYWPQEAWQTPYCTRLIVGDVETYGPRGTGEFAFNVHAWTPEEVVMGDLAESWEITADKFTFHLREGAMWLGNERIGMEPREMTADDVAFHYNRVVEEGPLQNVTFVGEVRTEDRYTVVFDLDNYDSIWQQWLMYVGGCLIPPEVVAAGPDDWRHQVGSGPFILTDYLPGSAVTYEKNPDHWWTTTIDGKVYDDIPFIDKLVHPLIPDDAARIAAVRTGQADGIESVTPSEKTTLPDEMEFSGWGFSCGDAPLVVLQGNRGKFQDINLRRAMNIATDRVALADAVYGSNYVTLMAFNHGTPEFTPIEELPEEARMLFEYNPELAKQMLADAGYPDGFDMELIIIADNDVQQGIGAVLADQWSEIGVNVNITALEPTAHLQIRTTTHEFDDAYLYGGCVGAFELQRRVTGSEYPGEFNDPFFDEQINAAITNPNAVERSAILKEMGIYFHSQAREVPLPGVSNFAAWWPWLKNYYGELEAGFTDLRPMQATLWIDQGLKTQMGF